MVEQRCSPHVPQIGLATFEPIFSAGMWTGSTPPGADGKKMNTRWRDRWLIIGAVALTGGFAACGDDDSPTTPTTPPPTEPTVVAPTPPTGVSVTRSDGAAQVTWTAVSGAESYAVERRVLGGSGTWEVVAAAVTTTSYTDSAVEEGVAYLYRVLARNSAGASPASDVAELQAVEPAVAVLTGPIDGAVHLDASLTYTLQGVVTVEDGGELHMPAGTTILGSPEVTPTALVVAQGGKIFSEGTAEAPVVFTSANPSGSGGAVTGEGSRSSATPTATSTRIPASRRGSAGHAAARTRWTTAVS